METTEAKMFVRSLNNSTAKILFAFILARTALDVKELRGWTGMTRETIYGALSSLEEVHKVAKQTLAHGRIVWLPSGDLLPGFGQMSALPTPGAQMSGIRTPALVGGGDSIKLIKGDSLNPPQSQLSESPTSEPAQEQAGFPSAVEILSHTDLLFDGSLVVSKGLEHCIPQEVLAWCAYAYYQFSRQRLDRPAGLVRRRLFDGEHASEKMRAGWREILPDEFLEALGLIDYECEYCEERFDTCALKDAHRTETHPFTCMECPAWFLTSEESQVHYQEEHDPDRDKAAHRPVVSHEPDDDSPEGKAWRHVLDQLQMEMPRASFETWVRDSKVVRFDGNALSIGVHNTYARDWLESRLRSTVERLLVGSLNRSVHVEFVVAELETDHE